MKLSITATLTDEEVTTLARAKWWDEKVSVTIETENWNDIAEQDNPLTAADFIVNVYQAMIANDAALVFTHVNTVALKEQIAAAEASIQAQVNGFLSSSIE